MPPINEQVTVYGQADPSPVNNPFNYQLPPSVSPLKSTLLGAIPSLAGGAIGALSQFVTNEINYRRQMKMYEDNREYNSPAAQMQRFKDAGLNPNLIYGQNNTAQPVQVGSSVSPDFSFIGNTAQNAITNYRASESQIINNALGLVNYAVSRVNYDYLPPEKYELFKQLKFTLNKIKSETQRNLSASWLNDIEYDIKKLNYDYDFNQFNKGFAPDLKPEYRSIVGMLGQLMEYFGFMQQKEFNQLIFQTQ